MSETQSNDVDMQADSSGGHGDLDGDFISLQDMYDDDDDDDDGNDNDNDNPSFVGTNTQDRSSHNMIIEDHKELPPWMDRHVDYRRVNPLVALHNEIVGFCKLMEPHPEELKERELLVQQVKALVFNTFGHTCQVEVFGSQVTGLCLPSSDIDIAIQTEEEGASAETTANGDNNAQSTAAKMKEDDTRATELHEMENWDAPSGTPLQRLASALRSQWRSKLSYLEVIENTRIPLVKFTHAQTNICVDVCFNQRTGPKAATLMKQYMNAMPPLRPLAFVLKYFMASRGLNQPYTGGVGSFMLQLMIVSFLQHRERDAYNFRRPSLFNLGVLLVEFFEFYSTDFNFITTGLSVRFDGFYFRKGATDRKENFWQPQKPFTLAVENPLELTSDVGKPSFRMQTVQRSFEVAFKLLLSHLTHPLVPAASILASVLPPTVEMRKRATLARLKPLQSSRSNRGRERNRR